MAINSLFSCPQENTLNSQFPTLIKMTKATFSKSKGAKSAGTNSSFQGGGINQQSLPGPSVATRSHGPAQYEQIGHIDSTKQRVNYRPGQAAYNEPSFGLPCTLNHIELLGASGYHLPGLRWVISQLGQIAAQQTGLPIQRTHVSTGGFISLVLQRYLVLIAMEAAKVAVERAGLTWEGPLLFEDPQAVTKACTSFSSGCLLERELIEFLTGMMLPRVGTTQHHLNPNDVIRALGVGCEDCSNQGTIAGLCTSIRCRPAGHPLGNRVEPAVTGSNGVSTGFAAPFKRFLKSQGLRWTDESLTLFKATPEGKAAEEASLAKKRPRVSRAATDSNAATTRVWTAEIAERLLESRQDLAAEPKPRTSDLGYTVAYATLLG